MSATSTAPGARSSHGPSALGDDLRRFWRLTFTLAVTDFKLSYFGSVLGYFWSLARPLAFFGVIYVVFTEVVGAGDDVPYYGAYLLTAIVLYTFFSEATTSGVRCLVDRENLLRKIRFPRLVVPLATVLTAFFNLLTNLIAVFVFVIASGVTPHVGWLAFPLLVALLFIFALGISMLLSALYVRYRDVEPIWMVVTQIFFYASPILYVASKYPDGIREYAMMNPLATIITEMRVLLIDPNAPTAADMIGGAPLLLIPLGIVAGTFVLGLWFFNREAPKIAENL